jgi:protein tyrosine phosphatase (PTP) superfamily phosphohydrolase (DUF442 family)
VSVTPGYDSQISTLTVYYLLVRPRESLRCKNPSRTSEYSIKTLKSLQNPSLRRWTNLAWSLSSFFARWWWRALATFLVLVIALLIYVVNTIYHANFHIVASGETYRSGQMNEQQLTRAIQRYGIKSIFNLRGTNTSLWYQNEIEIANKLGVRHYDFALSANQEVGVAQMDEIILTLRTAPKPILIHCKGGADRAGLISALYCLAIKGQKPGEADQELSVWYGHMPLVQPRTITMDHSFWHYVSHYDEHTTEPYAKPVAVVP